MPAVAEVTVVETIVIVVLLPDGAVFGSDDPAAVDERPAAVVASVSLQADLPRPEEGAGLRHVPHGRLAVCGHRETSKARSLLTAGALLPATPVLCRPGVQTQSQGWTGQREHMYSVVSVVSLQMLQ